MLTHDSIEVGGGVDVKKVAWLFEAVSAASAVRVNCNLRSTVILTRLAMYTEDLI